jgi:hypothetical protein
MAGLVAFFQWTSGPTNSLIQSSNLFKQVFQVIIGASLFDCMGKIAFSARCVTFISAKTG